MRKKYTKKENERYHFKNQIRARYEIDLNSNDIKNIIYSIQGKSVLPHIVRFIERKSNTRALYEVEIQGIRMLVIYDNLRHELITVLPTNSYEGWKLEKHDLIENIGSV
jgi:hypothetical protein